MTRHRFSGHRLYGLLLGALLVVSLPPGVVSAAGGAGHVEDAVFSFEGPFGTYDKFQLQRGFQIYHEVCAACHGLKYVAFRELGMENGPAFPPAQVEAIAALYEVSDEEGEPGDTRAAKPSDKFPANDSVGAPDLSLMAKARAGFHGPSGLGLNQLVKGGGGPEYIYSLLTGYNTEDGEVESAGSVLYKNSVFPGGLISMAPPLEDGIVEYLAGEGIPEAETTVDQMAMDVSAFLMWAAEPHLVDRKEAGFRNIFWLIVLTVLLYLTQKMVWERVKKG